MSADTVTRGHDSCLVPVELRADYLSNPLGLDTVRPRLSWVLRALSGAPRGLKETAFCVRVASRPDMLEKGKVDLWDSGAVDSDATAHVEYSGAALTPGQQCHWAVAICDSEGRWSGWSDIARFGIGPCSPEDWTASWIGTGESVAAIDDLSACDVVAPPDNTMADPWFRKSFRLPAVPVRAIAHVASVGYHEFFVNGCKIGDAVLSPSVTDNSRRARYATYELTDRLREGENAIGLWLGTGWSTFPAYAALDKPRAPIVIGQFDFEFADGRLQRLITDASWKTRRSPSALLGIWYFMNFGGELHDAGRELDDWARAGLDDSDWREAVIYRPRLELSSDKIEPTRLCTQLLPKEIAEVGAGVYRVDMGRNFSGFTEIAFKGDPGERVEFQFSERASESMTHRLRNVFIVGPGGAGTFRNRFNYSTGRWITIRGLRREPKAKDIRGWQVRNDYAAAAAFECSHGLFNQIHVATRWTLENLMLGGYIVDCPHRERMGYGGDGHASITSAMNLFAMGAACTKWSEDWRDMEGRAPIWGHNHPQAEIAGAARVSGQLPYSAPTYWGGGGPAWSGFAVHLAWEAYQRYGDERILLSNLPTIERWLGFLEGHAKDNLLQRWGGNWDFIGDWLWPGSDGVNGDTRETLFFNNCYWVYVLQIAAVIAEIIGSPRQARLWRRRAGEVRRRVHAEFFNPADSSYVNGSQAYLAIALLAGVPPADLRAYVWKRLEHEILVVRGGHIHAGITGGALLFKLLMESGRDDLIYPMVDKEDFPSWGYMLRKGATTLWEAWSEPNSLLHSSFLFVGAWFIQGVLGIQPDPAHPGFRKFLIRPGIIDPAKLSWAKGHHDSIRGRISVSWKWSDEHLVLSVTVPPNTCAQIHLPTSNRASVMEANRPVAQCPEVTVVGTENRRLVLEVGSGQYEFTAELKDPCVLGTLTQA